MGLNWLASLEKLDIPNILIISLDNKASRILHRKGSSSLLFLQRVRRCPHLLSFLILILEVVHFEGNPSRVEGLLGERFAPIWQIRWLHAIELLRAGITVIMSDADVVWLQVPAVDLESYDIWASAGTYPKDFFARWGFTVCNGLLFMRGNQRVVSFLELMLNDILESTDDQISLNYGLERSGLVKLADARPRFASGHFYTVAPVLRLAVADLLYYARTCVRSSFQVTIHCPSGKTFESKQKQFVASGLWLLDENLDPMV